jgi:hypothetical protein
MAYIKAVRRAAPVMIEMSGLSGGGKTYSALLVAAGLAGPGGRVGLLDTEQGRGSLPADSKLIVAALPDGYEYDELSAPFSPERYTEKILEAEKAGIDVLCVDSTSHEYDGLGGISDIAQETKKKWIPAKLRHKRFLMNCLNSRMDFIFCFRGQPKVKVVGEAYIDQGIMPLQEKNWSFDMTFRWRLEEGTHFATLLKAPDELEGKGISGRLLTKADGELIRTWKLTGKASDPMDLLRKRARTIAEDGLAAYQGFFAELSKAEQMALKSTTHEENKGIGKLADEAAASEAQDQQ